MLELKNARPFKNIDNIFVKRPRIIAKAFKYVGFQVVNVPTKGNCVFATKDHESGLLLPYGGVLLASDELKTLSK
jgi:hypothetical protein